MVTHKGCLDGAGCVINFLGAGGKLENVRYVAAGMLERFIKNDPMFTSDRFLIIADIGLNTPKHADTLERRGNLVLLDHHITSNHLVDREWAHIDVKNERCGTELLRWYLTSHTYDMGGKFIDTTSWMNFSRAIDAHDRWRQEEDPDIFRIGSELATLMVFLGQDDFVARFRDPKLKVSESISQGRGKTFLSQFERDLLEVLQRRRDENIAAMVKRSTTRPLTLPDGSWVTVAYAVGHEPNVSLLLERLGETNPTVDATCLIDTDRGSVSLRSNREGFSVVPLAQAFGGGGHAAAAGHRLPPDLNTTIIEAVHG